MTPSVLMNLGFAASGSADAAAAPVRRDAFLLVGTGTGSCWLLPLLLYVLMGAR